MTNVKLPRLLDANLKEIRRLHPKTQSAEINLEPLSVATLSLRDGEGVRVRDFIELYTARGTAGIFRVKSPNNGYGTYTDTVSLEHGVCVLGDAIIPGEGTISGTARDVLTFMLGYQAAKVGGVNMWTLGDVDVPDTETVTYDYRSSNTLHAILDVMGQLGDYMLRFDQSVFPWVMHVKAMETAPSCEGRLGRNVNTAHVTIDDTNLCTRVYCPRLPGGYMQLEEDPEWGIVEQPLDFDDTVPLETVEAECRKYLEARKEPAISVEIDGFELAATTGESLDSFDVGRMMRLALPKYGVTVEERITAISYASMLSQPETVRIYLANKLEDASTNVSRLQAEASSMQNWRTKTEKVVTNLKETDEGIKEVNDKMVAWFSSVEIDLDATEDAAKFGALASYQETYDLFGEVDTRVTEAELILYGDGTSAQAGLIARVEENEEQISAAALTLYGDSSTAQAGLVARVGENEASITATAAALGTRIDLKADKTYVNTLIANEIEAVRSSVQADISEEVITGSVVATNGVIGALELGGDVVRKTTISVVTGISGNIVSTADVDLLTTEVGEEQTMSFYSRGNLYEGALFKEGTEMAVAGEIYDYPLYRGNEWAYVVGEELGEAYLSGTEVYQRGTLFEGTAYRADGSEETAPLFYTGTRAYTRGRALGTAFAQGTYTRLAGSEWFPGGTFCMAGKSVRVQGEEETAPLFETGGRVTITTQGLTALTT